MPNEELQYKSYCWSVGSTSFREQQLSYKNEVLIRFLHDIFKQNPGKTWRDLQTQYYDALKDKGFITGNASRKDKDARQKTTGLVQVGLCSEERFVSEVGEKIVKLSESGDFSSKNIFEIDEDSYTYLLQFLKYQLSESEFQIKPFVAFLYMVIKLGHLSREEFTYCLPVCKNVTEVIEATTFLINHRGDFCVDEFLIKRMMEMGNYQNALNYFINTKGFGAPLIMDVGMHRKSHEYDRPFAPFFEKLYETVSNRAITTNTEKKIQMKELRNLLKQINANQSSSWVQYFGLQQSKTFTDSDISFCFNKDLCQANTEEEFKTKLFKQWHLFKWKSTLEDYYDLNKRYFNLTDVVRFDNQQFVLTEYAIDYFSDIIDKAILEPLIDKAQYNVFFQSFIEIEKISPLFSKTKEDITEAINNRYGKNLSSEQIDDYIADMENKRFLEIVDRKFPIDKIGLLLDDFKNRNDNSIKELVTTEATVSTSFEYIVGIAWYMISGRQGYLKKYLKLSLDSNFLPKSHAPGGGADIIFSYDKTDSFPSHDMLLEVTLSESTGQRQMEWEPVSRHLETHIKTYHNVNDYVLFVASILDSRTISAFRTQKYFSYNDGGLERCGLKILPIDCELLKHILLSKCNYADLFSIFNAAYISSDMSTQWQAKYLSEPLQKL